MIPLLSEVQAMQNPALGAVLLWRFACGYNPERTAGHGVPLPLAFAVLPVVLHARTHDEVGATRIASGVRKFEEKFKEQGDMLLAVHKRARAMRLLSLRSLRLALSCGLLTLMHEQGTLWPRTYTPPKGVSGPVEGLMKGAEKMGAWCAPLSLFELSGILRLEF